MRPIVKKITNLPIKQFSRIQKAYPEKLKMPAKTCNFDIVRIMGDEKLDIFTFYEKPKKENPSGILRRFFIKHNSEGKTITERNYIPLKKTKVLDPEDENDSRFLTVLGRKILTIIKKNDKYAEKIEETQTVTQRNSQTPVIHISKITTKPSKVKDITYEIQSLKKFEKGVEPKGYNIITSIKSGKSADTNPRVFQFKNMPEFFKSDVFFPYHLYSFKHFKKIIPQVAKNPEHRNKVPKVDIKWFKDNLTKVEGFYDDGTISLNSNLLNNRYLIVNKAAHENEHAYQDNEISKLLQHKKVDNLEYTKKYKHDFENYVDCYKYFNKYHSQFIEQKAREAGCKVENLYRDSSFNLKNEFPYAPDYLIGPSIKDELKFEEQRPFVDYIFP